MKIAIINGPNINMVGIREPQHYGKQTYQDLLELCRTTCESLNIDVEFFQSNHEGAIVDFIQSLYGKCEGIIINPAAYTHTSIAILDALKAIQIPAIEVHLSKVEEREAFRQISYAGMACFKTITGLGIKGYEIAIKDLLEYLKGE